MRLGNAKGSKLCTSRLLIRIACFVKNQNKSRLYSGVKLGSQYEEANSTSDRPFQSVFPDLYLGSIRSGTAD